MTQEEIRMGTLADHDALTALRARWVERHFDADRAVEPWRLKACSRRDFDTPEMLRGFSAAMLERGADQIYLFNHMDHYPNLSQEQYLAMFREAGKLETIVGKPRRHLVTYRDISPPDKTLPMALPADLVVGGVAKFSIYIGPKPTTGRAIVRVGLGAGKDLDGAQFAVRMNGADCKADKDYSTPGHFCGAKRALQFEAPLSAMKRGYNQVDVSLAKGEKQRIVWMEIYIVP